MHRSGGVRDGKWVFFDNDGSKSAESVFKDDVLQGKWTVYDDEDEEEDPFYDVDD